MRFLQDLLQQFSAPAVRGAAAPAHEVQLATAVLLAEVMRADPALHEAEREVALGSLQQRFGLSPDELHDLLELARSTGESSYDYHRFTQAINSHFSHPEKVAIVEAMWQVAYADLHIDVHENHIISKIAGLLHVTHGEYIAAKLHAKQSTGLK